MASFSADSFSTDSFDPNAWDLDFLEDIFGGGVGGGGNPVRRKVRRYSDPVAAERSFTPKKPVPVMAVRRQEKSDEEIILSMLPKLLDG